MKRREVEEIKNSKLDKEKEEKGRRKVLKMKEG